MTKPTPPEIKTETILDSIQEMIICYDKEMRILWANAAACASAGLAKEVLKTKRCWEIWEQRQTPCHDCPVITAMQTGEPHTVEKTTPDQRTWMIKGAALKDDQGVLIGGIETALEITESKKAERALQLAFEILNRSPAVGFMWANAKGWPVRFVTPNVDRIFGYSADDFLQGRISYESVVHPEDLARVAGEVARYSAEAGGVEFAHEPYRIVTKGGRVRWISDSTVIDRDENGNILFYKGIIEDVTERIRTERAFQESEERFRQIAENISEVFWLFDWQEQRVLYASPAYEQIWGRSRQALYERPEEWVESVHPDDRAHAQKSFSHILQSGGGEPREYRIVRPDGDIHWISDVGYAVKDAQGRVVRITGLAECVTAQKQMEAELLKMEKLESLSVLAGGIAHDFNNFLAGIIGNLSLARFDAEPADAIAPRLEEMEKAALRAKNLTQQLLTFSKGGSPIPKPTYLSRLVEEAALFALRGTKVNCDFAFPSAPILAEVDESQISQVIHNLVLNAVQAMPEGGTIKMRGERTTLPDNNALALDQGDYVLLQIQDQGTGITPGHLKKVFDPYFTTKQRGSGLGLAVVYSVITKHNGRITVDSQLGAGTTFSIYLPASPETVPEQQAPPSAIITVAGRILVMDDEDLIRDMAFQMLKKMGYTAVLAKDGEEALRLYQEALDAGQPFDAVILDLTVSGGMGGKETIRKLLDIDPGVKAIVSSGYSNDPVMSSYGLYGFRLAVKKPYLAEEMNAALQAVLAQ